MITIIIDENEKLLVIINAKNVNNYQILLIKTNNYYYQLKWLLVCISEDECLSIIVDENK